jgi:hypothetical protein
MVFHLVIGFVVALFTSKTQIEVLLLVVLNKADFRNVLPCGKSITNLSDIVVIVCLILVFSIFIILDIVSSHHIVSGLSSDDRDLEDSLLSKINHLNKSSLELQIIRIEL